MKLINKKTIKFFENLDDINEGFRIPDAAYIHGKEPETVEEFGGDSYFSNFWYGPKEEAVNFAESLAKYFKKAYAGIVKEEYEADFFGMVVIWYVGDNALVANLNLRDELTFWEHGTPQELQEELDKGTLELLMSDGDDNNVLDMINRIEKKLVIELFPCVCERDKGDYIEIAKENGVSI